MKRKYFYVLLVVLQAAFIFSSGVFRRRAWKLADIDDLLLPSQFLSTSNWLFLLWLATIACIGLIAAKDKENRLVLVLFPIVILPSIELMWWIFYSM
ncbi:MAG: hypothetical protein RL571_3376 [Pseudomonadota bacterium]|jgi:DMSO reductase anchor subunit